MSDMLRRRAGLRTLWLSQRRAPVPMDVTITGFLAVIGESSIPDISLIGVGVRRAARVLVREMMFHIS
jgi:hypothetical protein